MIQWGVETNYLLVDLTAHFKVRRRQLVKTKELWVGSDIVD